MYLQKQRWSRVYESSEEELQQFLADRDIAAERVVAAEFEQSETAMLDQDKGLWCAEGSLKVVVDGKAIPLQAGDSVQLKAGSTYQLQAGIAGYTLYIS